jgi:hypothetical protein
LNLVQRKEKIHLDPLVTAGRGFLTGAACFFLRVHAQSYVPILLAPLTDSREKTEGAAIDARMEEITS